MILICTVSLSLRVRACSWRITHGLVVAVLVVLFLGVPTPSGASLRHAITNRPLLRRHIIDNLLNQIIKLRSNSSILITDSLQHTLLLFPAPSLKISHTLSHGLLLAEIYEVLFEFIYDVLVFLVGVFQLVGVINTGTEVYKGEFMWPRPSLFKWTGLQAALRTRAFRFDVFLLLSFFTQNP